MTIHNFSVVAMEFGIGIVFKRNDKITTLSCLTEVSIALNLALSQKTAKIHIYFIAHIIQNIMLFDFLAMD